MPWYGFAMMMEPRLDIIGAALADPSRSRILCELMDGRAFTNKELACAARITAQTASAHLKHLEAAGLTSSLRSGRNVYHHIASEDVAAILESLASLSPTDHLHRAKIRNLPGANTMRARSCYNHIAGRLGVMITERMVGMDFLQVQADTATLGKAGDVFFRKIGIDMTKLKKTNKPIVKPCLDWTERKNHLSGPLATEMMNRFLEMNYLARSSHGRALEITATGYVFLQREFGLSRTCIDSGSHP